MTAFHFEITDHNKFVLCLRETPKSVTMDGYVEKLGDIGKDDLERRDLKDTVLKELGVHTENISQLTEQRKVRWDN